MGLQAKFGSDRTPFFQPARVPAIQMKCAACEAEEREQAEGSNSETLTVQQMPAFESDEFDVQRKPISGGAPQSIQRMPAFESDEDTTETGEEKIQRKVAPGVNEVASTSATLQLVLERPLGPSPQSANTDGACDTAHANAIRTARNQANTWRQNALIWLETHLGNIRRRVPAVTGQYGRVGSTIVRELRLLNRHFAIARIVRDRRGVFPRSPNERLNARDLEILGSASYDIRRRFSEVEILGLHFRCQGGEPPESDGADWVGSAVAGSNEFTIYTVPFDAQQPHAQSGVVLHEAFHASFHDFDHDTYAHRSNYPGHSPLTNADSYAAFASFVTLGRTFRVIVLPAISLTASPGP